MKSRLALRAAALLFAALATTACGKISVGSWLNVDTSKTPNQLSLPTLLGGTVFPLGGGIHGVITIDTTKILSSPGGIMGTIVADKITIAAPNTLIGGSLASGTICVRQDPNNATAGTILVSFFKQSSAQLQFNAEAKNFGGIVPLDLFFSAPADIPLTIDWSKLLTLNLNGAIKATTELTGNVTLPVFGPQPFDFLTHLTSSTKPPSDPIASDAQVVSDCTEFWAGN